VPIGLEPQPSRVREWPLYAAALASYVPIAIWQKFLLNWVIGPLWLVLWVEVGTRLQRRRSAARASRASRAASAPAPEPV
jgi:hypothetical protein